MTGKRLGNARIVIFLIVLLLAVPAYTAALADDTETQKILPGEWILYEDIHEEGEEPWQMVLATLRLDKNGTLSLQANGKAGGYSYSCSGTWSFEFVPDGLDRVTLRFTSTDYPQQAGGAYSVDCVYTGYTESWENNDTRTIVLLLEPVSCSGVSPFEDLTGIDGATLYREQGPNMKVVNCQDFVSLRKERSKTSARLAKVPLGALVLAFPEAGEENGFIQCLYNGEYGYILSEYLKAVD